MSEADGKYIHAYLDGVRVSFCVMADWEHGVIQRLRTSCDVPVILNGDVDLITERGAVRVEFE